MLLSAHVLEKLVIVSGSRRGLDSSLSTPAINIICLLVLVSLFVVCLSTRNKWGRSNYGSFPRLFQKKKLAANTALKLCIDYFTFIDCYLKYLCIITFMHSHDIPHNSTLPTKEYNPFKAMVTTNQFMVLSLYFIEHW